MEQKKALQWIKRTVLLTGAILVMAAGITFLLDPYFHYHKPVSNYRLREARYTNNGIARHFDYEAIIIGTSMTGNFSTSEYQELFGCEAVKLTLPGASFRETSMQLERALQYNEEITEVLLSLDLDRILMDWDWMKDYELPEFLYDDVLYNDLPYLLNKSILLHDCLGNLLLHFTNGESTTMDEWGKIYGEPGLDSVLADYTPVTQKAANRRLSEEEVERVRFSIQKNFGSLIEAYPQVTFRFYVPPYSIYYWNEACDSGTALTALEAERIAIRELIQYDNVEVYCFYEEDAFLDTQHYLDKLHFSTEYGSALLRSIALEEHRLDDRTLDEHMEATEQKIMNYPYETLIKE